MNHIARFYCELYKEQGQLDENHTLSEVISQCSEEFPDIIQSEVEEALFFFKSRLLSKVVNHHSNPHLANNSSK